MRAILIAIVTVESLALIVGAGVLAVGGAGLHKKAPTAPVFRPPLYSAAIGDLVRYRRVDPKDLERVLGFLDYEVVGAVKTKDTGLGPRFAIRMTRLDADGRSETRMIALQPELIEDGWMPPRFDEAAWIGVPGGRPVIRAIRTAMVAPRVGAAPEPGFEIDVVIPRDGLDRVAERFRISPRVPVFGVARWERADEVLLVHHSNREPRRDLPSEEGQ